MLTEVEKKDRRRPARLFDSSGAWLRVGGLADNQRRHTSLCTIAIKSCVRL